MAATPTIRSSGARTFTLFSSRAGQELLTSARVFSIYNFPSAGEQISRIEYIVPVKRASTMDLSNARVFALVLGRVANPRVRAWTFTLDGHDFYVLRLGDKKTLIYDTNSEQWVEWTSNTGLEEEAWRPNVGMTWIGGQRIASSFGSNIVAGDDTYGLLWFLNPTLPYDQSPDPVRDEQIPIQHIVTGQVLAKGRDSMPCFVIFVEGDNYGMSATDFNPQIELEFSDDQGRTFVSAGKLNLQDDYSWYSLGQIASPGRIFRVTDTGIFTRIDTMSMNDDAG